MQSTTATTEQPKFSITTSRQFIAWMVDQRVSLAFTTYQAGKVFLLGVNPNGKLSVFERTFNRCMGLWSDGQTIWMSSLYQLWRFENALTAGQMHQGYDRVFVPQMAYTTGDLDTHDIAVDANGNVILVNTLFSCLARPSETHSFASLWQPPFISKLAAEDRCHLNGLTMERGRPKYVTAVSQSDVADGWRDRRRDGGCVMDVESNEVVCQQLSMPHSPRLHNGQLLVLNSGTGHVVAIDPTSGRFEEVTFCPGYLRGMAVHGDFAVVGMSRCRQNKTFSSLALDENLAAADADARCGLQVIDLRSGDSPHWVRIEGVVEELYDVVVMPGVVRPMAIGIQSDEIRRTLSVEGGV